MAPIGGITALTCLFILGFIMTARSLHLTLKPTSIISRICPVIFKVVKGPTTHSAHFKHPTLTEYELQNGCCLGIDSWADTSCAGKHAHVLEFLDGRTVTAKGFAASLPSIENLNIANVAYAYDSPSGKTFVLEVNNSIYLGLLMDDSLLNPIQCMLNGIKIDIRPHVFAPDCDTAQSLTIPSLDVYSQLNTTVLSLVSQYAVQHKKNWTTALV